MGRLLLLRCHQKRLHVADEHVLGVSLVGVAAHSPAQPQRHHKVWGLGLKFRGRESTGLWRCGAGSVAHQ